jgi:hypothetical protein
MKLCLLTCPIFTLPFAADMFSFLCLISGKCHLFLWWLCGNHSICTGWHHVFQSSGTWIVLVSETCLLSNLSRNELKHTKNAECHFTRSVRKFPNLLGREIIFMWQPSLLIVSLVNVQTAVAVSNVPDVMWIHKLKENVSSTFIFDEQKTQYCVLCVELKYVDFFSWQVGRATSVMPPAVRHSGLSEILLCVMPNVTVGAVQFPRNVFWCLHLYCTYWVQSLVRVHIPGIWYRTWFVVGL